MQQDQHFISLFARYADKTITEDERSAFFGMIRSGDYDELLRQLVGDQWKLDIPVWEREQEEERAEITWQAVLNRVKVKKMFPFRKMAVAAVILIMVGIGTYFIFFDNASRREEPVIVQASLDIKPPSMNRAMVTLANGDSVFLDSAQNGKLAMQGAVQLVKTADGEIRYEPATGASDGTIAYNTLFNPRGSKVISIMLVDGSKVWLNSESSLRYPASFIGNTRVVEITGEAYFEVMKDKSKPFHVRVNDMDVEVLGTHFNINSYADEGSIKTTLLEGRVKVNAGRGRGLVLQPGQQAVHQPGTVSGQPLKVVDADLEQVMAWKDGLFNFNHADLKTVMQQLARWYDMDVKYEGDIPSRKFRGKITRDLNLSQVLSVLEDVGVKFRIDGKTLVVTP